ncbi:MAG TPA: CarD family transcriptional regulator [Candidatus Acidoferrales bacterium]|jgi:CarD family transcriptional regulator|nr:CarD family transcriptional regulator [Candidatus Acidoferrales bacterium]
MSFKVGDKVVYPNHGVGIIEQITHNHFNGRAEHYYLVKILANGLRVTVPCLNADCVGLRPIIRPAEVPRVMHALKNGKSDGVRDWKSRFKLNSEKMRTGSPYEVAAVLKSLVSLGENKILSFREKKMLERARQLLVAELAVARNVSETTIEQALEKQLGRKLRLNGFEAE